MFGGSETQGGGLHLRNLAADEEAIVQGVQLLALGQLIRSTHLYACQPAAHQRLPTTVNTAMQTRLGVCVLMLWLSRLCTWQKCQGSFVALPCFALRCSSCRRQG